jgi:hypothetical protein
MKKIIYILIFILNSCIVSAQGFNWQYSSRFPEEYPDLFAGIRFGYNLFLHDGSFNFIENLVPCCNFSSGTGSGVNIMFDSEYWIRGDRALNFGLGYFTVNGNFELEKSEVVRDGDFRTKFIFNSSITYLTLSASFKQQIPSSMFYLTGGLDFIFLLSSSGEHSEVALTSDVPFDSRIIERGKIDELSPLVLSPFIKVGYDTPLSRNIYASPFISAGYTINSILVNDSWRRFNFNLGISIFRSVH